MQSRSGMQQQPRWLSAEDYREGHSGRGAESQRSTSSRGILFSSDPAPVVRGSSSSSSNNSNYTHTSLVSFPYSAPSENESPASHVAELDIGGIGQTGSSSSSSYPSSGASLSAVGRTGLSREILEEDDHRNNILFGEGSRQLLDDERLHVACETTLRRQRVTEMQERLRRCAGFPPPLDLHELERRGLMASGSVEAQRRMEVMSGTVHHGLFRSGSAGRDSHDIPGWAAPSFMQALDHSDLWEGSFVGPANSVSSSGRASPPMGDTSSGLLRRGSTTGREGRRTSGRRLWDALSRATSHRRSSASAAAATTTAAAAAAAAVSEENDSDAMVVDGVEGAVDVSSMHGSRALDLEERRRRVRSQVRRLPFLKIACRRCSTGVARGCLPRCCWSENLLTLNMGKQCKAELSLLYVRF